MGTRNLTIVKSGGKTKIAQYGQWDGYPTGQGQTIADFLKKVDLDKFKQQVESLGEYSEEDIKAAYREAGSKDDEEFVTMEISRKVKTAHPALNRDHGAGILELVHNGVVNRVHLEESFKEDSLYCEYYYTIDLDKKTVSMNGGKEYTFEEWAGDKMMTALEKEDSEE